MKTFQVGNTYTTRSIGDANCLIHVAVLHRTAKTITTVLFGKEKTLRISIDYRGNESVRPWGNFSMAPRVSADQQTFPRIGAGAEA